MNETVFDLIVLGAGPGGYVAAIRAAQLGRKVAVVEQRTRLGGVCLNEGCIPSKALLDSSELFALARDKFSVHGIDIDPPRLNLAQMMKRKEDIIKKLTAGISSLLRKNGVEHFQGRGTIAAKEGTIHRVDITAEDGSVSTLTAEQVLLATGSRAVEIPDLPFDGQQVVDAKGALAFDAVPEHLVVVGGGYIGLELGSVWARLGAKVTVVEMLPEILPNSDSEIVAQLKRLLERQGLKFLLGTRITGLERQQENMLLKLQGDKGETELACDRLLVAAGRRPQTAGLGLEAAGVELDEAGRVLVDENYRTSIPGVYAIGDLIDGPMLAHRAMEEGTVFAERLSGKSSVVDYPFIPGIIYTHPEAASVGRTEQQLKAEGIAYQTGKFPFIANGRAKAMEERDGFVKVLAAPESGRVLGIHILGPVASELIAEAVTVMSYGGSVHDMTMTFHAHPTLSEAVKEAALAVTGDAVHG